MVRRNGWKLCGLLVGACFLAGGASAQSTLYGSGHLGPDGLSNFYTLDALTGAETLVGAIGFERCGSLACNAAGVIYAACERADGSNVPVLITIDPMSGAGTEVGPNGLVTVSDLSFRNSDSVLFAYDAINDPVHTLFTIDPMTGGSTLVGDTGLSTAPGNAIAFDLADTLFQSQLEIGPDPELNTLDQMNGTATFVTELPIVPPPAFFARFNAMAVDPATGTLFGALNDSPGGGTPGGRSLATIDPMTGTVTILGTSATDLDGIAFCGAGGGALPIPTLGFGAMAILALLLVTIAVTVLRRSRAAHGVS